MIAITCLHGEQISSKILLKPISDDIFIILCKKKASKNSLLSFSDAF